MKIFLDDIRSPKDIYGEDWNVFDDIEIVKEYLLTGEVTHLSLDNDLGVGKSEGHELVRWMIENNVWPTEECLVHSANIVRADQMRKDISRFFVPVS